MFLHSNLHAVSKVSSPHFSLLREVSWLENEVDPNPVFKASWTLSFAGVLCEQENGKPQSPEIRVSLLFVLSILFICPSRVVVDVKHLQKIYSAFW